jgi:DNA-binding sugar fermentation-stimulating protein
LMKEEKSPERKTFYTAVTVDRDSHPIMLHTHCTNEVALV